MVGVARAEEQWPQVGDEATGGKLILSDWLICPNGISRPDLGSVIETLPFTREVAPRVDFYAVFYILEDGNLKMWLYLPVIEGRLKSVIGLDGMELKFREIDKWIKPSLVRSGEIRPTEGLANRRTSAAKRKGSRLGLPRGCAVRWLSRIDR